MVDKVTGLFIAAGVLGAVKTARDEYGSYKISNRIDNLVEVAETLLDVDIEDDNRKPVGKPKKKKKVRKAS